MNWFGTACGFMGSIAGLCCVVACGGDSDAGDEQGQGLGQQTPTSNASTNGSSDASNSSSGSGGTANTSGSTQSSGGSTGNSATSAGQTGGSTGDSSTSAGQSGGSTGDSATSTGQSGGSAGAGASQGNDTTTTGGGSCEEVQCLRPYECALSCDSPTLYTGCCPCEAGQIDKFIECGTGGGCEQGDTKSVDCNTCTCDDGQWACTEIACESEGVACGGWLGDTCTKDEYCAYQPGQHCGAADASALCQPRPQGCTLEYAPVCGCDNQTYSNACAAASSGTGVLSEGECP